MKTSITFWLALASLSSLGLSCNNLECGEGTIEEDGVCKGTVGSEDPICGPGTIFNATSGQCTPDYCGDGTANPDCGFCPAGANPIANPVTGVIECISSGGGACTPGVINCPDPGANKFMACGAIFDIETSALVDNPAALKVQFYDALKFAQSTPETRPLPLGQGKINECGQFSSDGTGNAQGISPATFVAIAVDDATDVAEPKDDYVLTGVGVAASANTEAVVNGYATRKMTVTTWEDSTGVDDLETKGVLLPIYLSKEATVKLPGFKFEGVAVGPIAGVTVTGPAGQIFYFADTDRAQRSMPVDGDATGPSGSALLLSAGIDEYSGEGPDGCDWASALGGSNSGVVFIAERHDIGPEECN